MAYLNWSADLETGIDIIDQDHKVLVDLLNQVHDCLGDEEEAVTLGSVLNALVDYTEYHFAREERIMQAAVFPDFEAHRRLHQALVKRANEFRARHARAPSSVNGREVLEFLREWLINHILKQDFQFRSAVVAHPEAVRQADTILFDRVGEATTASDTEEAPAEQQALPAPPDFSTMSVLVVDDNPNFQVILRTILKGLGCPAVSLASEAEAGLVALQEAQPSLVLVDWRMEGVDGLEFVRRARAMGVGTPIIMISGYSEPGFAETARIAGVDAFLEKPITARRLTDTVAEAIDRDMNPL